MKSNSKLTCIRQKNKSTSERFSSRKKADSDIEKFVTDSALVIKGGTSTVLKNIKVRNNQSWKENVNLAASVKTKTHLKDFPHGKFRRWYWKMWRSLVAGGAVVEGGAARREGRGGSVGPRVRTSAAFLRSLRPSRCFCRFPRRMECYLNTSAWPDRAKRLILNENQLCLTTVLICF